AVTVECQRIAGGSIQPAGEVSSDLCPRFSIPLHHPGLTIGRGCGAGEEVSMLVESQGRDRAFEVSYPLPTGSIPPGHARTRMAVGEGDPAADIEIARIIHRDAGDGEVGVIIEGGPGRAVPPGDPVRDDSACLRKIAAGV